MNRLLPLADHRRCSLPIVGAVVVDACCPRARTACSQRPKVVALGVLAGDAGASVVVVVAVGFDAGRRGYQFAEDHVWIKLFGAHYALGVDGIGLTLVLLTAILTPS